MKRLALIAITAVIAGSPAQAFWDKYGSMAEANSACEEWARAGGKFRSETLQLKPFPDFPSREVWARRNPSTEAAHQQALEDYRSRVAQDRRAGRPYGDLGLPLAVPIDPYALARTSWSIARAEHMDLGPKDWIGQTISRRFCRRESVTNQFLGYEYNARPGETLRDPEPRIKKHFRY